MLDGCRHRPGHEREQPGTRNDNTAFFNDVQRGYQQTAFFTSVDFDIIPKVLTVTAGTRYYDSPTTEKGSVVGSFGCYEAGPAPCYASATNIDAENLHTVYKGVKSRGNVTLALPPGRARVLHVVAGLSAGRFQSKRRLLHPGRPGGSPSIAPRSPTRPTT